MNSLGLVLGSRNGSEASTVSTDNSCCVALHCHQCAWLLVIPSETRHFASCMHAAHGASGSDRDGNLNYTWRMLERERPRDQRGNNNSGEQGDDGHYPGNSGPAQCEIMFTTRYAGILLALKWWKLFNRNLSWRMMVRPNQAPLRSANVWRAWAYGVRT